MKSDSNKRKYYVYAYYSSDSKIPIYIGKGMKGRCFAHLERFEDEKDIKVYIIKDNLTDEEAFDIESACIDVIGVENLKYNNVKGRHSKKRIANQLVGNEKLNIAEVPDRSLIIYLSESVIKDQSINMLSDLELYERARASWAMSKIKGGFDKINEYEHVFVGFKKHIIAVYKNIHWFKSGTIQLFTRKRNSSPDRYEFVGKIDEKLSKKYIGKYYFDKRFSYGGGLYVLKK